MYINIRDFLVYLYFIVCLSLCWQDLCVAQSITSFLLLLQKINPDLPHKKICFKMIPNDVINMKKNISNLLGELKESKNQYVIYVK